MLKLGLILFFLSSIVNAFAQDTTRVKLLFVGDVMQHDSQITAAIDAVSKKYDYAACFEFAAPIVQSADLAFANLEVTLAGPPFKGYPQFSAPDELAVDLKKMGFDILVTANNHCVDRRKQGLERTIDVLDSLEMQHTGTFKDSADRAQTYPLIISSNGIGFSLLNYTYGTNGIPVTSPNIVNLIDTVQIKRDLDKAKSQQTDAIIIFMHWGEEYKSESNKFQKELADLCFKNGASLVIGSHPHVLQPMEWRKESNQLVAYSLGNFVSGQQSRYRDGGALLWVEMEKISSDSSSSTRIMDASYELEWVYRNNDTPKKYFILPLKEFETDTIKIQGKTARSNLKIFAEDSRKLLKQGNLNVNESARLPIEINFYKILLAQAPDSTLLSDSSSLSHFYGAHVEQENDSLFFLITDKFHDKEIATQALEEIKKATDFKEATLLWYYLGRRKDDLSAGK